MADVDDCFVLRWQAMLFAQAPDGQQINITLMDYTPAVKSPLSAVGRREGGSDAAWCPVIVQLREVSQSDCNLSGEKQKNDMDGVYPGIALVRLGRVGPKLQIYFFPVNLC